MKRWIGILSLFFLTMAGAARAEQKATPAAWGTYWTQFQAAVVADDPAKVATLTQFPFNYDRPIDKATFLKVYPKIIDAKAKKCLAKEKPTKDETGAYSAFCGDTIYTFTPVAGDYRFTDIGTND